MTDAVVLESRSLSPEQLRRQLGSIEGVDWDIRPESDKKRIVITEVVLVALIGAGAQMLAALITALVQYLTTRPGAKILIETDAGDLEVPASMSPEQVARLVERLSRTPPSRIILP